MGGPLLAPALLVQVHAHHQGLAQGSRDLDELGPGGVDAEDVADHEGDALFPGEGHELLALLQGLRQGLLDEHVGSRVQGRLAELVVGVRVGVDGHRVRLRLGDGGERVAVGRDAAQLGAEGLAALGAPAHHPHQLELVEGRVGARVGGAHVPASDHQDS